MHENANCKTIFEDKQHESTLEIGLAKTQTDFEDVFRFVYEQYRELGYVQKNSACLHVTLWSILPGSYIVIARRNGEIVGTVTCVLDGTAGLLLDEIAEPQLNFLRQQGRRLCELSADASIDKGMGSKTIMEMYRYAHSLVTKFLGITDFVIAVNPRHENFYKRILLFEQIAEQQLYKKVQDAPAVPLRLNLCRAEEIYQEKYEHRSQHRNLHHFFFKDHTDIRETEIDNELHHRNTSINSQLVLTILKKHNITMLNNPVKYKLFAEEWKGNHGIRK